MEVAEDTASDEAEDAIVMVDGDDDKGNECYELCFQNVRNETLDCIKKLSGCRIWGSRTNLKTCGKSDTFIRNLANPIPIRSQRACIYRVTSPISILYSVGYSTS